MYCRHRILMFCLSSVVSEVDAVWGKCVHIVLVTRVKLEGFCASEMSYHRVIAPQIQFYESVYSTYRIQA